MEKKNQQDTSQTSYNNCYSQDGVPMQSRVGREMQRYQEGERLIAGSIPYVQESESQFKILLISSSSQTGYVIPKGGWEQNENASAAAVRETIEESGVTGNIEDSWKGDFRYKSKKTELICQAQIFSMKVTEQFETWPEQKNRNRIQVTPDEAMGKLIYLWMQQAIVQWAKSKNLTDFVERHKHVLKQDDGQLEPRQETKFQGQYIITQDKQYVSNLTQLTKDGIPKNGSKQSLLYDQKPQEDKIHEEQVTSSIRQIDQT